MNPRFGRRSWVKLWVNEWLDGTTRFEMSDAQRAFWIDLLALAGRSRFPGRICAGEVDGAFVGYLLNKFQALMAEPIDVQQTLELFEKTGKIKLTVTSEIPTKLVMIELLNWDRYQSEYQRQKKYRRKGLQQSDSQSYNQSDKTEGEVEVEVEGDKTIRADSSSPHGSVPSQNPKPPDGKLAITRRVWAYYIERLNKNPKLLSFTAGRKQKGMARLRECLAKTGGDLVRAEGLMRLAIDAMAASAFHCGDNDRKKESHRNKCGIRMLK